MPNEKINPITINIPNVLLSSSEIDDFIKYVLKTKKPNKAQKRYCNEYNIETRLSDIIDIKKAQIAKDTTKKPNDALFFNTLIGLGLTISQNIRPKNAIEIELSAGPEIWMKERGISGAINNKNRKIVKQI